jgi:hypothetical protein
MSNAALDCVYTSNCTVHIIVVAGDNNVTKITLVLLPTKLVMVGKSAKMGGIETSHLLDIHSKKMK